MKCVVQGQQGELVLIHLEASVSWPGVTVPSLEDKQEPDMKKVQWYGHSMTSEVRSKRFHCVSITKTSTILL